MLSRAHVITALQAKQQDFLAFEDERMETRSRYGDYVQTLAEESQAGLTDKLSGIPSPGALPTTERVQGRGIVLPFQSAWQNHQEARAWAMSCLKGVRTVAVDGSQITPDPSLALPVGAVQIGWFENPHDAGQRYIKDIAFEILSPGELSPDQLERQIYPDQLINVLRFERECQRLAATMRAYAGVKPTPLCFFDGSLAISFAAQMRPAMQRRYIDSIVAMLKASEESRVPLVAYVDTSYASDLVSMLRCLHAEPKPARLSDGAILRPLMEWGDRTEAWECARDDRLFEDFPELAFYDRVHLVYLKTSVTNPPVRLDLPAWILEDGRLDEVIDLVRAECIVGTGYPYCIETADAVAVITMQDREHFYGVLQDFVEQNQLSWTFSRKTQSKRGRR